MPTETGKGEMPECSQLTFRVSKANLIFKCMFRYIILCVLLTNTYFKRLLREIVGYTKNIVKVRMFLHKSERSLWAIIPH